MDGQQPVSSPVWGIDSTGQLWVTVPMTRERLVRALPISGAPAGADALTVIFWGGRDYLGADTWAGAGDRIAAAGFCRGDLLSNAEVARETGLSPNAVQDAREFVASSCDGQRGVAQ